MKRLFEQANIIRLLFVAASVFALIFVLLVIAFHIQCIWLRCVRSTGDSFGSQLRCAIQIKILDMLIIGGTSLSVVSLIALSSLMNHELSIREERNVTPDHSQYAMQLGFWR